MRKFLSGALALLALSACGSETTTGPGVAAAAAGTVRFSVPGPDGQTGGTFNASGALSLDSLDNFTLGNWAYAELGPYAGSAIDAYASAPAPNGRFYYFEMELPRDAAAGAVLPADIFCDRRPGCAAVRVYTNLVDTYFEHGDGPKVTCGSQQGSVRVAERGNGRIKGTFAVTSICGVSGTGTTFQYTAADGSFDLPLIERSRPTGA